MAVLLERDKKIGKCRRHSEIWADVSAMAVEGSDPTRSRRCAESLRQEFNRQAIRLSKNLCCRRCESASGLHKLLQAQFTKGSQQEPARSRDACAPLVKVI
jgi:hypothetical protein